MKYVRNNNYEAMQFDKEWAILNTDNHTVTTINEVGNFFWEQLENPKTLAQLVEKLHEEYNVENKQIEVEIEVFLKEMQQHGLVAVK